MRLLLLYFLCLFPIAAIAQIYLSIEEVDLESVPAIHSGVYAEYGGYWLLLAGRKNGLHDFRPPLAFPASNANNSVWLIDPLQDKSWSVEIDQLSDSIRDPLASANLQWAQKDSFLFISGGYGWNSKLDSFITFPTLTVVNLKELIKSVKVGELKDELFQQIQDRRMAVCGGNMAFLDGKFYLVFGHDFNGRYHREVAAGFFKQQYTNQIRSFEIVEKAGEWVIDHYMIESQNNHFHRRDYNLVNQYFGDDRYGLTAFSGVFQEGRNLPFYDAVNITSDSVFLETNLIQKYAHYHSATLPIWDSTTKSMNTIFFGGMAEYYFDGSLLKEVRDTNIPFVKTISMVTRKEDGSISEQRLDVEMPSFLGTNAHFYPASQVVYIEHGIVDFSKVHGKTLVGYIFGGMESELDNINQIDVSMSWASKRVFEVYLSDDVLVTLSEKKGEIFYVYPNPTKGFVELSNVLNTKFSCIQVISVSGEILLDLATLENGAKINTEKLKSGTYIIKATVSGRVYTQGFQIEE